MLWPSAGGGAGVGASGMVAALFCPDIKGLVRTGAAGGAPAVVWLTGSATGAGADIGVDALAGAAVGAAMAGAARDGAGAAVGAGSGAAVRAGTGAGTASGAGVIAGVGTGLGRGSPIGRGGMAMPDRSSAGPCGAGVGEGVGVGVLAGGSEKVPGEACPANGDASVTIALAAIAAGKEKRK